MDPQTTSNHTLPSFADLSKPDEVAFKEDAFLAFINKPCPEAWVKKHPYIAGGKHKYLPIDKVRWLLTRAFGAFYKEEILSVQQHFNSEVVAIRLHYCIPGTNIWLFQDGVGAAPVQTDKGEAAANLAAIRGDAVMKAAPSAASYAVGNAAAKIGKVFGGDLNKDDALDFTGTYSSQPAEPQITQPLSAMTPAQALHAAMPQAAPQPTATPLSSLQNAVL